MCEKMTLVKSKLYKPFDNYSTSASQPQSSSSSLLASSDEITQKDQIILDVSILLIFSYIENFNISLFL